MVSFGCEDTWLWILTFVRSPSSTECLFLLPHSSPHASMSLLLLPSLGQLVVLPALQSYWEQRGARYSCKDAVSYSCNYKMTSKNLSHPSSLVLRAALPVIAYQLLPVWWWHCLWHVLCFLPAAATACSTSIFWERVSMCTVCTLNSAKQLFAACLASPYGVYQPWLVIGVLRNPLTRNWSIMESGSQLCLSKPLTPTTNFLAHENPCWLLCIFRDWS